MVTRSSSSVTRYPLLCLVFCRAPPRISTIILYPTHLRASIIFTYLLNPQISIINLVLYPLASLYHLYLSPKSSHFYHHLVLYSLASLYHLYLSPKSSHFYHHLVLYSLASLYHLYLSPKSSYFYHQSCTLLTCEPLSSLLIS